MSVSNNLIIDFANGGPVYALRDYLHQKGQNADYVWIDKEHMKNLPERTVELLQRVNSTTRIYIVEHGMPNQTTIAGTHYQKLANLLAENNKNKNIRDRYSQLKISLIPCFSGRGDNSGLESFAGLFHRYLGQHHKIYATVLARTDLVSIRGAKYTTSESEAFLMKMAAKAGREVDLARHQHPGTKVELSWDHNGYEWAVDAYIDKYFLQTKKVLWPLCRLFNQGVFDEESAKILGYSLRKVYDLVLDKSHETYKNVAIIDEELVRIREVLINLDAEEFSEVLELIEKNLSLSRTSINANSLMPKRSDAHIASLPKAKEVNIEEVFNEIELPIQQFATALPDTESGCAVKESTWDLKKVIINLVYRKLLREHDYTFEREMGRCIERSLSELIDTNIPKEGKLELLKDMEKQMLSAVQDTLIGSAEFTGALEGIRAAKRIGGWVGVINLPTTVQQYAQRKVKEIEQLSQEIRNFINTCINYINTSEE